MAPLWSRSGGNQASPDGLADARMGRGQGQSSGGSAKRPQSGNCGGPQDARIVCSAGISEDAFCAIDTLASGEEEKSGLGTVSSRNRVNAER